MRGRIATITISTILAIAPATFAQVNEAWAEFVDTETGLTCGIVNAANTKLIVLLESGTMVAVSGADIVLEDLVVNSSFEVSYLGEPAGFLLFQDDGDGVPAVFWTTLAGTVVQIDTFSGQPQDSGREPGEFRATGCQACQYIDSSIFCDDSSGDDGDDSGDDSSDGEDDEATGPIGWLCGSGSGFASALTLIGLSITFLVRRR